jgi:hypothetical protein
MQISVGNPRPVRVDEGVEFLVAPVRAQGWAFTANALVVNPQIKKKALELLPVAHAMATSKATRVGFFKRSRESLDLSEAVSFQRAEQEAEEASLRVEMLFALAKGENTVGKRLIGVDQWREILSFFHQEVTIGAIQAMEG